MASWNWSSGGPPPLSAPPEAVVYGTVCLDRFVLVDAAGEPLGPEVREMPGGEAFNTATALAGWGVRVLLTGTALGDEPEAARLCFLLDSPPLGIARDFVPEDPAAVTPVCTVQVYPDGERRMSGKGFAQAVAPPPLPAEVYAARPVFVTDPNLGPAAVAEALRAADYGCPVIAMDFAHVPEVVARSRIVVTSREVLSRQGTADEPAAVASRLVALGAQAAIVTLGPEGCVAHDRDAGPLTIPAFRIDGIIDTTGAGDAFRAGLAWGLLNALPVPRMIRFASAAAALHCRVLGGASRNPLEDVLTLTN